MDKHERHWFLGYAIFVMIMTCIPYLFGFLLTKFDPIYKNNWVFTGFIVGVEDGNSYIAKELNGSYGEWLFRTPYTAYPQHGVVAFLPYLLLGKLAAGPELHLQLVVLFHIFRFCAGILAILATADFLAIFVRNRILIRIGIVIATLGGGLGWLLVLAGHNNLFGSIPLEFYSPETFGFLELFGLPHLSLARACMLWGLASYLKNVQCDDFSLYKEGIKIGFFWLLIAFAQPVTAVIFGIIILLYICVTCVWQILSNIKRQPTNWLRWRKQLFLFILSGLFPGLMVLYTYFTFSADPYLVVWTRQNKILSPNFVHYLLAFGMMLSIGFLGIKKIINEKPWPGILLVGWVAAFPFLAYAPVGIQRRLPEGIWVAIVCLAILGLEGIYQIGWLKQFKPIVYLLMGLTLISTILIFIGSLVTLLKPIPPIYRPVEEVQAFEYLTKNILSRKVILTSYETGNALPAWVYGYVLIGHGPESAHLESLRTSITKFYSSWTSDIERLTLIKEFDINYIFWGPNEMALGGWNPEQAPYLRLLYKSNKYQIYEVDSIYTSN